MCGNDFVAVVHVKERRLPGFRIPVYCLKEALSVDDCVGFAYERVCGDTGIRCAQVGHKFG